MIEIAICDDEKMVTSEIEQKLNVVSNKLGVEICVDVFFNGKSLADYIINSGTRYSMIYLDIEMKAQNGIDTARRIRLYDKDVLLIFVTNYEVYVKETFEVGAFRFISKPISDNVFERYFLNALEEMRKKIKYFQFKYDRIRYKIPLSEISYFQSDKRLTYIHRKTEILKCYEKLNIIEQRLQENEIYFFRIHQSFLLNPAYVEIYRYDSMRLRDGTVLSISANHRKRVSELYCRMKGDSIIV